MEKLTFTYNGYKLMLQIALDSGYEFRFFNNFNGPEKICVLRHDIDADLFAAYEIAKIGRNFIML